MRRALKVFYVVLILMGILFVALSMSFFRDWNIDTAIFALVVGALFLFAGSVLYRRQKKQN